jgi:proline iminopeptidase
VTETYPSIEQYEQGWLDVGDGHRIHWETSGDHHGKPAVVVHGGPGSGCTPWHRRLFDPARYRIVLFDQRGCGRSTPHASEAGTDLSTNTTQHLVADMDRLRAHLGIDRWLVLGGSWGSTLSLAYAETHPDRVSELVLWGVTTGRRSEADWLFRGGVAPLFPAQWEQLRARVPEAARDDDVVEAYARRLHDPDPEVREQAALAWCTHYVAHDFFLEDGALLRDADRLAPIPGVLVQGRFDLQAPLGNAWALHRAGPSAELVIVEAGDDDAIARELVRATDRFATVR